MHHVTILNLKEKALSITTEGNFYEKIYDFFKHSSPMNLGIKFIKNEILFLNSILYCRQIYFII